MQKSRLLVVTLAIFLMIISIGKPAMKEGCIAAGSQIQSTQYCCSGLTPVLNNYSFKCQPFSISNLDRVEILSFEELSSDMGLNGVNITWKHISGVSAYQVVRSDSGLLTPLGYVIPGKTDKISYLDETALTTSSFRVIAHSDSKMYVSDQLDSTGLSKEQVNLIILEIEALNKEYKLKLKNLAIISSRYSEIKLKKDVLKLSEEINRQILTLGELQSRVYPKFSQDKLKFINRQLTKGKPDRKNRKAFLANINKKFEVITQKDLITID